MTLKALTANRLRDGIVVYLDRNGAWIEDLDTAWLAEDEAGEAALLEEGARGVAAHRIVAPYLIDVARSAAGVAPVRYREVIRAGGPSVETIGTA